ncbi:hypothetical protein [Actinomadura rudentiformis]|uniref:Uncharacterized protein n=1 Tax=Actinomadura rudentiformis TaxID=359158 RepID=A0A6H9YLQ1_9ACTN|nr:hypothetical protein [Actinomadura rudentiformis]KAB2341284.1 hypothetical protein F8566_41930 [Actinomadura rudentiformis]
MTARTATLVGIWLAIAVLMVAVGLAAVQITVWVLTGSVVQPMSGEEIRQRLATEPALTPRPESSVAGTGEPRVFTSPGGRLLALCAGRDQAVLTDWSPAIGYRGYLVQDGPAPEASVVFGREDGTAVRAAVRCTRGFPRLLP